jgi:ABC-type multidrug transport system fused ATPase/permease subunit
MGATGPVRCLAGLQEPTEGAITFDAVAQKKLSYRDLRRQIGFVLQENYLFDDTIAKNIAFGEEDLTWSVLAGRRKLRMPMIHSTAATWF